MVYYTVRSLTHPTTRVTTYSILRKGGVVYRIVYKAPMSTQELGRFSRYTIYDLPKTMPYGKYTYLASLKIGKKSKTRSWTFAVARRDRIISGSDR